MNEQFSNFTGTTACDWPNRDCTLRVGIPSTTYWDFKCHKFILSKASIFFDRTLCGYFKEAKMGPDEPILLDKICPSAFECALRHMYGQATDLKNKSVWFRAKVYKIADEMLIASLVKELESSFVGTTAPGIFSLFDLYRFLGNRLGINACKEILSKVTVEDLRSEDWHKISPEGVEEYLKMECLDVEEADLARALVSWGRFQVRTEGGNPADSARLRSKILPGLRWIRFAVLDQEEFTQLCRQELGTVLSEEEKNSIIKAITSSKQTPLRPAVEKRSRPPTVFNLPCVQHCNQIAPEGLFRANLIFHLDKSAAFIGLNVVSSTVAAYGSFTFEIYNAHNFTTIGRGGSEEKKISYYGEDYYQINPKGTLTAGDKYNLTFTFPRIFPFSMHLNYPYVTLPLNKFTHNGLTLTIDSTVFHVLVKSMLFVKSP